MDLKSYKEVSVRPEIDLKKSESLLNSFKYVLKYFENLKTFLQES